MNKPKRKNDEQSIWRNLADFILLAKPFEYEVDWTPEETSEHLRMLAKSRTGFLLPIDREAKITEASDHTYDFEIRVNRYGRGLIYNTAKAACKVLIDHGIEKTVVRGEIKLGITAPFFFLGVIVGVLLILYQLVNPVDNLWFAFAFLAFYLFYVRLMVTDYGKLNNLLRDTLSPETTPKKKKNDEKE